MLYIVMGKILSLNEKPPIYTYTQHAFLNAIIGAPNRVNDVVAKVSIRDFDKYIWKSKNEQITYKVHQNILTFMSANKYNVDMNSCLWRECAADDKIEIIISEQLNSFVWGAINLFIANSNQEDMLNDNEYIIRVGNFCKDHIYARYQGNIEIPDIENKDLPLKLIMKRENTHCEINFINNNNEEYKIFDENVNELDSLSLRIGVEIKLGNCVYYEWLYSNYIHLCGNLDNLFIKLDYLCNPVKNWKTYTTTNLVDYNIEDSDSIQELGFTILEYIKRNINLGRYIEIELNDNILDGLSDDDGVFMHQNLIYGYDDDEEHLYIMHFQSGKPDCMTMSYSDFESPRNNVLKGNIVVVKYNSDYAGFKLDKEYIKYSISVFLHSSNPYKGIQNFLQYDMGKYGINMLRELCTDKGIEVFKSDIRISHLLYEREQCMANRIEYFYYRKLISEENFHQLHKLVSKAVHHTYILQNIVIKYQLGKKVENNNIKKYLMEYLEYEIEYLKKLISSLD